MACQQLSASVVIKGDSLVRLSILVAWREVGPSGICPQLQRFLTTPLLYINKCMHTKLENPSQQEAERVRMILLIIVNFYILAVKAEINRQY
jgi:hypothetical protein